MLKKPVFFVYANTDSVAAVPINSLIYYNLKLYLKTAASSGTFQAGLDNSEISSLSVDINFSDLGDVSVSSPVENQILTYNSSGALINVAGPGQISGIAQLNADQVVEYDQYHSLSQVSLGNKLLTEVDLDPIAVVEYTYVIVAGDIGVGSTTIDTSAAPFSFTQAPETNWRFYINGIRISKSLASFSTLDFIITMELDVGDELIFESVGSTTTV